MIVLLLHLAAPPPAGAKITLTEHVGGKTVRLSLCGLSQVELRGGPGMSRGGGPFFRAQTLRLGFMYFQGPIAGKLALDFSKSHTNSPGGLPTMIKCAFVARRWSNAAFARLGLIRIPVGMEFSVPGWDLDIAERAEEKGLVLERSMGLLLSGRLIGRRGREGPRCNGLEIGHERRGWGWGYDIGIFNPAGRSGAVRWDPSLVGEALAGAVRLHFDRGPALHVEASWGFSQDAGGIGTADYTVWDVGIASERGRWDLKAELIHGRNIRGLSGWDERCGYLSAGFMVLPTLQAVVRPYLARTRKPGHPDAKLANIFFGLNWYLAPLGMGPRILQRHKIVINYVLVTGDTTRWTGTAGHLASGWILQWQLHF